MLAVLYHRATPPALKMALPMCWGVNGPGRGVGDGLEWLGSGACG
jgi:hypothetical protein